MPMTRWEPFQEIERWEPFREVEHLQQRMNRLFERLIPNGDGGVSALTLLTLVNLLL
jgi:HSP20 family protein